MRTYLIKRLLLAIPTLLGVSVIVFCLVRLIPGDAILLMMAESANVDATQVALLRRELGLDRPTSVQYFVWLGRLLQGDLGTSLWKTGPVLDEILARVPVTVQLMVMAVSLSLLFAIPMGVISAVWQDRPLDYAVRVLSIIGLSVPNFWVGVMVVVIPSVVFLWTPPMGYIRLVEDPRGNLVQFFFPALVLGVSLSASVMRITRSALLEVLRQDYVRTARAKGLAGTVVVLKHGLKNAMIPIVSLIGVQVGFLLGGTVIVEQIFTLPGIGRLVLDSISQRDYPLLQGAVLFIALAYILVNLAVDMLYTWVDPRVRYE
jgi:peptide/nickel transport system permease protein